MEGIIDFLFNEYINLYIFFIKNDYFLLNNYKQLF